MDEGGGVSGGDGPSSRIIERARVCLDRVICSCPLPPSHPIPGLTAGSRLAGDDPPAHILSSLFPYFLGLRLLARPLQAAFILFLGVMGSISGASDVARDGRGREGLEHGGKGGKMAGAGG